MAEAYKIQNNFAPPIMETMLERKAIPYDLKNPQDRDGLESLRIP